MRWTRGSWLGVALAPLLLAACGPTGGGGPGTGGATPTPSTATASPTATAAVSHGLTCTLARSILGVDVIQQMLTCGVKGASTSETRFTLTYYAADGSGRQRAMAPACTGALSLGAGSCTQTYSSPAPMGSGPGSVSGVTAPHQYSLGPVTPIPVAGTRGGPGMPGGTSGSVRTGAA